MKDTFLITIAENLKLLRQGKNLSLEKASNICNISKSMFAQIERCEVNPTITTLGKIAYGFNISIEEIIYKSQPIIQFIPKEKLTKTFSFDKKTLTLNALRFDAIRRFEHNIIEIDVAGNFDAKSSPENSQTFITVFKGNIITTINEKSYNLSSGDTISFQSNIDYSLFNSGKKSCRLSVIIYYPISYVSQ